MTDPNDWKQRALEAEAKIEGLEKLGKADTLDGLRGLMKWALEKVSLLSGLHSAALAREAEAKKPCVWGKTKDLLPAYTQGCRTDYISRYKFKFCPDCGHPVEVKEEK